MARDYTYISADSHLEVDSARWVGRVPAKFRDRAPRLVRTPNGGDAWAIENRPLIKNPGDLYGGKGRDVWKPFGQRYEDTPGTGSPEQRLREQAQDGVDAEVLFPPQAGGARLWRAISDDEPYLAMVRAYNDFLAEDYCSAAPDRLIAMGVIPWSNLHDALAELEHCKKIGLKGVVLGRYPNGKGYPLPEDDDFWAAALDMQMPLTVHVEIDPTATQGANLFHYPDADAEMREGGGIVGQLSNVKFCRLGGKNAAQLIFAGAFDRFPKLRIFFAENNIGWVPHWMEQADERYIRHSGWAEELLHVPPLERTPSEYVREFCYWGFQNDPVGVKLREYVGVDRAMWASDFPHQETNFPESMQVIEKSFAGVPEDEKRRMVAENAIEFFHLN
jgi:predicted TIM-barrel fold metal-dependent hydrolase